MGGRMAVHFAQSGHEIVLGSSRPRTQPSWLSQAEVTQIHWNDDNSLEHNCCGIDVVIQAAGMNAQDCAADPVAALAFNGVATARLLAAAIRAGVKKFIYLSTAHVYTSPLIGTITEETCPRNLHAYATSHLAGEHAVLNASQCGQIQGTVLRLSNAFGAPIDKEVNCWMLLVNDLCRQAVETRKIVLQTNGLQQRDFVSLTWVCRVAEHIVTTYFMSPNSGILNIGGGVSQSVLEMALLIQTRCKQVLGFVPTLHRPIDSVDEQHTVLIYGVNKLTELGMKTNGASNSTEIDALLRYCHVSFSEERSRLK